MKKHPFRKEKDSMGTVNIPATALYGPQTQRAINNFTIATKPMPLSFIHAVALIKLTAAETNMALGLLETHVGEAIIAGGREILAMDTLDAFPVSVYQTGSGTSTNMNVNEVICGLALNNGVQLSPNDHVNLGQSSNDVIPSAMHIAAATATQGSLLPHLAALAECIRAKGEQHRDIIKTGRTHLMDALPIRLKNELEGWAAQLDDCYQRIDNALVRLLQLALGGTALGSGVNCHPEFAAKTVAAISEHTGLAFSVSPSLYKSISSIDSAVELSSQLKTTAVALTKIANDLRWMNSGPLSAIGEITLPALQPGSSIMPAKINPVIPEAVCMACAQTIGNDTVITLAGQSGNFQLNTMLPVAATNLLESIGLIGGAARDLGEKAIANMTINESVYTKALAHNPILVTALTPKIGYMAAAKIGKMATESGRSIMDIALAETDIPEEELRTLLDPRLLADGGRE